MAIFCIKLKCSPCYFLVFAVRWFYLIKEGERISLSKYKKYNINHMISQDRIEKKIPKYNPLHIILERKLYVKPIFPLLTFYLSFFVFFFLFLHFLLICLRKCPPPQGVKWGFCAPVPPPSDGPVNQQNRTEYYLPTKLFKKGIMKYLKGNMQVKTLNPLRTEPLLTK